MNSDERKSVARAAAAHLQAAVEDLREAAREVEARTGHRVIRPEPIPITDATRADLENAKAALLDMLSAVDESLRWVGPNSTLGRTLKVMPQDAARELTESLVRAELIERPS